MCQTVLSQNPEWVKRGVVRTESEQILTAAFQKSTGRKLSRFELYSRPDADYPEAAFEEAKKIAEARAQGLPLQYLTGFQQFLDSEYEVTPAVLVPRPETEALVVELIRWFESKSRLPAAGLEIGLGSGAISVSLLKHFPQLRIRASELSESAIEVAVRNATKIIPERMEKGDLLILKAHEPVTVWSPFEAVGTPPADFIISNPPYLQLGDPMDEDVVLHEPQEALFAPPGVPLHFYREIAKGGRKYLNAEGVVLVEIPSFRAKEIREVFEAERWNVRIMQDLGGNDRMIEATLPGAR